MTKFLSSSDERLTFDAKNLFFASDYHYGHASIIQYCKRPYVSVDEMDQALSFGLQETVPHKGVMVFLGDLTFHTDPTKIDAQIHSLRAETKILVRGNHDGKEVAHSDKWDLVVDHLEVKVRFNGKTHRVFLSHYPHYSLDL
jgi:calcineurin-like phosphoesterase family protein